MRGWWLICMFIHKLIPLGGQRDHEHLLVLCQFWDGRIYYYQFYRRSSYGQLYQSHMIQRCLPNCSEIWEGWKHEDQHNHRLPLRSYSFSPRVHSNEHPPLLVQMAMCVCKLFLFLLKDESWDCVSASYSNLPKRSYCKPKQWQTLEHVPKCKELHQKVLIFSTHSYVYS